MNEPITEEHAVGFAVPNILLSVTSADGAHTMTVREGKAASLVAKTTQVNEDGKPDDVEFRIRATNRINFAGSVIDVINDECDYGDIHLVATSPTASEYMALVGKEVLSKLTVYPNMRHGRVEGEKKFVVGRTRIILP